MKTFLSIAGSDSSAGAGVEQDIRTINRMGFDCITAITGRTLQSPDGVAWVYPSPLDRLSEEINFALNHFHIGGIKIGAIFSLSQIDLISSILEGLNGNYLIVVDPVFIPTKGNSFLPSSARRSFIEKILPLADIITPNLGEAEEIILQSGLTLPSRGSETKKAESFLACNQAMASKVDSIKFQESSKGKTLLRLHEAAEGLQTLLMHKNCKAVITGGDTPGLGLCEYLVLNKPGSGGLRLFQTPRRNFPRSHGTGCAFSSALLVALTQGYSLEEGFFKAKIIVEELFTVYSLPVDIE